PDKFKLDYEPGMEKSRILLVDDTLFFRHLVKNYFHSYGFKNITCTRNGLEALELLRENGNGFDLVVSDIEMPVMDGFELVSQIRSDSMLKHLPVMALSGLNGEDDIRKALDCGFDAFEMKIDKTRVIEQVTRMLGKS
ncbi:MAG: two-component system chemotaxis sensor kinase CheA, partial [bacterium]